MSSVADGNAYEDVFVFEDLVYAMERRLRVVHVYRNRNNSLIKLHDIRYPCDCKRKVYYHSIIVTNEYILHCCITDDLVSVLDRSGELLRKILIPTFSGHRPVLRQVDGEGNILMSDRYTNSLLIAHVDQPRSRWRVVNLKDLPSFSGGRGAVWFRHRLYVTSRDDRLFTFAPVDLQGST